MGTTNNTNLIVRKKSLIFIIFFNVVLSELFTLLLKNKIIPITTKIINKLIIVTGKGLHSENEIDTYVTKDLGILKNN